MKRRMIIMLISVFVLFGLIFGWKGFKAVMLARYLSHMHEATVTVSTMKVGFSTWNPVLKGVGSLRAIIGVEVTTELAGMVQKIYLRPGTLVKEGDLLVQLNADSEIGQLQSLEAQVVLAKLTFERDKAQYAVHAVSKQAVDTDEWSLKNLQGQVTQQSANVQKKTLRAPFTGRIGISHVNPGQYLTPGDKVTTLQTLNPIYFDFYMPQQALAQLKLNQETILSTDTFLNKKFHGKITTIEPAVDTNNRNVLVEATIANPKFELTPGMFANVEVDTATPLIYLTLPQSAVSFNPYGDIVYVIKDSGKKDSQHHPVLVAHQVFVTTGDTRGDQIAILKGLHDGDIVVTSGQLKLKNGSLVTINNTVQPSNSPIYNPIKK